MTVALITHKDAGRAQACGKGLRAILWLFAVSQSVQPLSSPCTPTGPSSDPASRRESKRIQLVFHPIVWIRLKIVAC